MHARALLLAALAWGCSGSESAPPPPHTTIVEAPPPPPATSALVVHEWGLVDVPLSAASATISATPACTDVVPSPSLPSPPRPPPYTRPISRPRAPMLYFHLPAGAAPVDTTVRVALAGGAIGEHWPLTGAVGDAVTWHATIRPEHCAGASYPRAGEPPCDHGACEASELAALETADASCVHVLDADYAHLFYAGSVPLVSSVRITRDGDAVTILDDADEPLPAPVWIVERASDRSRTRIGQAIAQPHSPVALVADHTESDVPVLPSAGLNAARMSDAEIAAFGRAWDCAIFGGTNVDGSACTTEVQPTHFVLYWLPRSRIDAMAPLVVDPAPSAIERAILVRVDLDH